MKNILRIIWLTFVMVGGVSSPISAGELKRIGLSQPNLGWPYIAAYTRAFEAAASKHRNVDVIVLSAQGDIAKQASDMESLIAKKVDIILVCSLDGNAIVPSLIQASKAGIPVLAISNEPSAMGQTLIKGYSGPDDRRQGKLAAELLNAALGGKGNVVVIEGTPGQSTTLARSKGFTERLQSLGSKINVLARQTAKWDPVRAKTITENFITAFGNQIDGLFSHDDNTAAAAAEVLQSKGRIGQIKVVGIGGSINGITAIKNGLLHGTVGQSPTVDAEKGLELALKILVRSSLEMKRNIIAMPKITAGNVSEFRGEW